MNIEDTLNKIRNKTIAVFGDIMLDQYLSGDVSRISPEAPVQIVNITKTSKTLGGAGNVILNLFSLGVEVTFLEAG